MTTQPLTEAPALRPAGTLRTVLVDDEPAARRRLRTLLADHPDVEIVAEFGDAEALSTYLEKERPSLVFLDIRMPGQSGLDIARKIPGSPRPILVFATAYEEHAVEAFGVQAADYLLKPIARERLAATLERVRLLCAAEQAMATMPANAVAEALQSAKSTTPEATLSPVGEELKPLPLNRIIVPAGERMIVLQATQIDWIESAGNYAIIHVGRDTHVLRETLTELDLRLAAARFMRISRSTIVNMDRVRELRNNGGGAHEMVLADGVKLPITRGIREIQAKLETG